FSSKNSAAVSRLLMIAVTVWYVRGQNDHGLSLSKLLMIAVTVWF
nr:hypothetical protein [Tanacetum cinerariifolium]GFD34598.1 hypothetical protein [Tanacetum cinerariifolium]